MSFVLHPKFEEALTEAITKFGLEKNSEAIISLVESFLTDEIPDSKFNSTLKNMIDQIEQE